MSASPRGRANRQPRLPDDRYALAPEPSRLSDIVDVLLDKGTVVDFYSRVCLTDLELVAFDGRMVIAGIDTYLGFADAIGGIDTAGTGARAADSLSE